MEDGFLPSKRLREMEVVANSLFDTYRKLYERNFLFTAVPAPAPATTLLHLTQSGDIGCLN